jgi:hypothetical protein
MFFHFSLLFSERIFSMHTVQILTHFSQRVILFIALACLTTVFMNSCTSSTDFGTPRTISPSGTVTSSASGGGGASTTASPVITAFAPTSGAAGATIIITGTGFQGTTAVRFGGNGAASFTVNSDTQITAVVGSGGASGTISVITPSGTASIAGFTFIPSVASITAFTPTSGKVGTQVTITGSGFAGTSLVSFGGVPAASFMVVSNTQINAVVGNGSTGTVSVHTPSGILSSPGGVFTVLP